MGNCVGQQNPEANNYESAKNHQLQKCNGQVNQLDKNNDSRPHPQSIDLKPTAVTSTATNQRQEKEKESIKYGTVQVIATPRPAAKQSVSDDVKILIADLLRKSKKGLIRLRDSPLMQDNQDRPQPQQLVSQQNKNPFPPTQIKFSYEFKAN